MIRPARLPLVSGTGSRCNLAAMQTSYDVIESLFRKRPAERMGLRDSPWTQTTAKWVAQGMPVDSDGKPVDVVEHFDFDMTGVGGWFDWHPKRNADEILEETDEWKIVRNGSGAALKWWKTRAGTPEHMDFTMTDRAVWDKEYRPHLVEFDPSRVDVAAAAKELARRREQGLWCHYGHQFVWECMRGSMGDYTLYTSLLTDPDWIHDYCRVYTDLHKAAYKLLIEEAGKPDGVWMYEDMGYKGATFANPEVFAELIFPYFAEMTEFFHGYDLPVVLHTCGLTEPLLDLIVEAGFDGLHPMEVKAGNDPLRIAESHGDKLVLLGGLDERILESGDRELIRKSVTDLLEGMRQRNARYVYCSDHSISTNVDYEDFRYAIEVYKDHAAY